MSVRLALAVLLAAALAAVRPPGREPGICRACGAFGGPPPHGCPSCGQVW